MKASVMLAGLLLMGCGGLRAEPGDPLDRGQLELRFSEDFSQRPSFYHAERNPNGRWKTNFFFSFQNTRHPRGWESRTLRPNRELEYYGDPNDGLNPFEWAPGQLAIVARRNPAMRDPLTHGLPYLSGLITTEKSFTLGYGYFEARVTMPVGKGLWPAFWLLPVPDVRGGVPVSSGQQELDIFENIGRNGEIYATLHHDVNGKKKGDGERIAVERVDQPHDYGVLVSPQWIIWYVDGREVRRRLNTDYHRPSYMLLNLAVGGDWPGPPDAATPFPARMVIHWVRAWALKPGLMGGKGGQP